MTLIKESVDVCSLQLHRLTILIILDLLHFIHLKQQKNKKTTTTKKKKNQFCALGQGNLSFFFFFFKWM